jgi:hypothetical protein
MKINKHNYEAFFLDYHEGNLTPQQVADLLLFVEQHPEVKEEFENFENFTLEDYSSYTFENKEALKKEITESNRKEYFIGSVDGALSQPDTLLLDIFLKQHPQYSAEFELFQKTKLSPDTNIVFENRSSLKRIPETADHFLISAVEGLLRKEEQFLFEKQLAADPQMRKEFTLYKQTILSPDANIVLENRNELKRKENKVVPLFYYVSSIAAAILVLTGLFFLFNTNGTGDTKLAGGISPVKKENSETISPENLPEKISTPVLANTLNIQKQKKQAIRESAKDSLRSIPVIPVEGPKSLASQEIPENKLQHPEEPADNNPPRDNPENAVVINESTSKNENTTRASSREFMSLGEIAAEKIKERTLDPQVLAI